MKKDTNENSNINEDTNREIVEEIVKETTEEIDTETNNEAIIVEEENVEEKSKSTSWVIKTLAVLSIIFMIGTITIYGYARYLTKKDGSVSAKLANIICEIAIQPNTSEDIIHPYCTVNIKNFKEVDGVEKTSETGISFKVEVKPKGNFQLPEYYWQDSNGIIISENDILTGNFGAGIKESQEYTIVFKNSGEAEVSELVNFSLVAVQSK